MVGWLCLEQRRGWRAELEQVRLASLPVLRADVPAPSGLKERSLLRRTGRTAALLARRGVRRVLTAPDFPLWAPLRVHGLRPVDPAPLCRALAAPLALAQLERLGVPPSSAAVALVGRRVDRALFQAAVSLCPQVRTLVVDAPSGGAALSEHLRREFGAAALSPDAAVHVHTTLCFSQERISAGAFALCGPTPNLLGFSLLPPTPLPEDVDPLPLAALLWEEGRLSTREFRPVPGSFGRI